MAGESCYRCRGTGEEHRNRKRVSCTICHGRGTIAPPTPYLQGPPAWLLEEYRQMEAQTPVYAELRSTR